MGPTDVRLQIEHARGFAAVWRDIEGAPPETFLDLGSGGGLPGLALLEEWHIRATFVDAMEKRMAFIREVLSWEDAPAEGDVITGRAEVVARLAHLDEKFLLVTARSFGPPAVTAECAARFLAVGGILIVSEPPEENDARWNRAGLGQLGLRPEQRQRHGAAYQVIRKFRSTPAKFPRAIGTPGKSPLFS